MKNMCDVDEGMMSQINGQEVVGEGVVSQDKVQEDMNKICQEHENFKGMVSQVIYGCVVERESCNIPNFESKNFIFN